MLSLSRTYGCLWITSPTMLQGGSIAFIRNKSSDNFPQTASRISKSDGDEEFSMVWDVDDDRTHGSIRMRKKTEMSIIMNCDNVQIFQDNVTKCKHFRLPFCIAMNRGMNYGRKNSYFCQEWHVNNNHGSDERICRIVVCSWILLYCGIVDCFKAEKICSVSQTNGRRSIKSVFPFTM